MCGRYVLEDFEELSERLIQVPLRYQFHPEDTYNAAPTQTLPVIVEEGEGWTVRGMHWGLIPRWTKPGEKPKTMPINARSETLAEKRMFSPLLKDHRCLVPISGFYEWKAQPTRANGSSKQPYFIHRRDVPLMLLAGLYDEARDADGEEQPPRGSFTIITTSANDRLAPLHDRMPVVLDDEAASVWMDPDETEPEPLTHLLAPFPDEEIDAYPVSRAVNNTRHNTPDLIERIAADDA